ncbi:glutathione-dependent formaldehyde-activating enzyme [Mariannaea sp. PMI_226]|nr:glutathione-dependent formaldehyde-activating enzyme [Mariannaea sp. PMI_226]
MADEQQPKKTYRGNCHCGAFIYEIDLPEIKAVNDCNCSICSKKGYLWLFPGGLDSIKIVKGSVDELTNYTFGKGNLHHKFCPHCGIGVLAVFPNGPPNQNVGLNARTIQGLDTWSLPSNTYDGAALGEKHVPPQYSGSIPSEQVEDGKICTGSCHCGSVQVALSSKQIDGTFTERIGECNCSICQRNGYIWIWPRREHVVIHGDAENIGRYFFKGSDLLAKIFCKKCGVQLTNEPALLSEAEIAALSEDGRNLYGFVRPLHPVNLRVLDGLDLGAIKDKVEKIPGANNPPKYQEP